MKKLSILIPSRGERFLVPTVNDLLAKASDAVEVIVVLDGEWANPMPPEDPRVTIVHFSESRGMRNAINCAASLARGDVLMKIDAHCMVAQGYDRVLRDLCEDNTILVPRRYPLDAEAWAIQDNGKPPVDYHRLSWPYAKPDELGIHGERWDDRGRERAHLDVDEELSFQGSCWVMRARHWRRLGGMSEVGYGRFVQEAQELGMKTWLGGGQVLTVKSTHYSHLHKGRKYGRGYFISKGEMIRGTHWSTDYWMNDRWEGRQRNLEWLVDRFWPLPGWPENWQDEVRKWQLGEDSLLRRVA